MVLDVKILVNQGEEKGNSDRGCTNGCGVLRVFYSLTPVVVTWFYSFHDSLLRCTLMTFAVFYRWFDLNFLKLKQINQNRKKILVLIYPCLHTQFQAQSPLHTESQISLLQNLVICMNLEFQWHDWIKYHLSCWFDRRKGKVISVKTKLSVVQTLNLVKLLNTWAII